MIKKTEKSQHAYVRQSVQHEVEMLERFGDGMVITKLLDVGEDPVAFYMLMDFYEGGDLLQQLDGYSLVFVPNFPLQTFIFGFLDTTEQKFLTWNVKRLKTS